MSALLVGESNHQLEGAYDMTHRKDDNALESVLEALIANPDVEKNIPPETLRMFQTLRRWLT